MKITTWNVNSIRARIDNIKKYLKYSAPDIVLFQEIKTEEQNYPYDELNELGYIYLMLMVKKVIMVYRYYLKKS